MGSARRQQAIANGLIVENAEAARRRRRQAAAIAREDLAITLWARGKTAKQVSEALFEEFGVKLTNNIPELVRRGLFRRVEQGSQKAEEAREMMVSYYREILEVWMPRALGAGTDPDTGLSNTPDPRAADVALKALDKLGVVTGAMVPPRSGDINLNVINGMPADPDLIRTKILGNLSDERDKQREIEQALAGTPADIEGEIVDDGKIMPPIPAAPIGEV